MHISRDEVDLLADPRFDTGYRFVKWNRGSRFYYVRLGQKFEGHYAGRFPSSFEAARHAVGQFKSIYGEDWPDYVIDADRKTSGVGWRIVPCGNRFELHVCPCGVWFRIGRKENGKSKYLYDSACDAVRFLKTFPEKMWPMFGMKMLTAAPYRQPVADKCWHD